MTTVNAAEEQSSLPETQNLPFDDTTQQPHTTLESSGLPAVLQSAYRQGCDAADTSVTDIKNDKTETVNAIADHGMDPMLLPLTVERWLHSLLDEFLEQHDHFKHQLREKYLNDKLNIKCEDDDRIRSYYSFSEKLEEARNIILSHEKSSQNYLREIADQNLDGNNDIKQTCYKLLEDFFKILHLLEEVDSVTKTFNTNQLKDIQTHLLNLQQLNGKEVHRICVCGLEKAGKSTYINALIGFDLLPSDIERCTQIRTVLKPQLEDDRDLLATVKFYNDDEFSLLYDEMSQKTEENPQQLEQRKAQILVERENVKSKIHEEYEDHLCTSELDRSEIIELYHKYIKSEIYVNIIKEVVIYSEKLPGKKLELIDAPGFDSPIKEHREAGVKAIKSSDAFVFINNCHTISLTDPQLQIMREIKNHFQAMDRAFCAITNLDRCQTKEEYKDRYGRSFRLLNDNIGFHKNRIYAVCPHFELLSLLDEKNEQQQQKYDEALRQFARFENLKDGFERSKKDLKKFIEHDLPKTHLEQLIELGRNKLYLRVLAGISKINSLLPQNLNSHMSIEEVIKNKKEVKWDQIFDEQLFKPTFKAANSWYTTIVTEKRSSLVQDAKRQFRDQFLNRTQEFLDQEHSVKQQMYETYTFTNFQLNAHRSDSETRQKLSFELQKIVNETSDDLAQYLYDEYISKLQDILNGIYISPEEEYLFHTDLTLEKCKSEIRSMILLVCRHIIMAKLTHPHSDQKCRDEAASQLILHSPLTASAIGNDEKTSGNGGEQGSTEILKLAEPLAETVGGIPGRLIKGIFNLVKD